MENFFISPILIVAYLCCIFILYYLLRTSEMINKKRFVIVTIILTLILIGISIFKISLNLKPKQKFEVVFFTFQSDNIADDQLWLTNVLPELIAKNLMRKTANEALIIPVSWSVEIINKDSINNQHYVSNISNKLGVENYITGKIIANDESFNIKYEIGQKNNEALTESITFKLDELIPATNKIAIKIFEYFKINNISSKKPIYSESQLAREQFYHGLYNFINKNYTSCISNLQKAISIDSSFAEVWTLSGRCNLAIAEKEVKGNAALNIAEFKIARKNLNRAIALDSSNDENYSLVGECYIYFERWSQAERMLDRALELNKNNPFIYIPLSRLHKDRYRKHGFRNEEDLYKRAIYLNPCYEDAYMILSDYYLFINERDKAIEILNNFLEINPNSVPVLMALGKIFIVRNDMFKIIEILNRVIELDPNNSDAFYNLGILYYNSKDIENAKKLFQKAIAIDDHLNSYLYLAYISELEGDIDTTIKYLRKRIHNKMGPEDEFAEEARRHLYKLVHSDSLLLKRLKQQDQKGE